jgi:aminoglycoside 6'-N-acetyltransferase
MDRPGAPLQGERVRLRVVVLSDEDALEAIFTDPEVTPWWPRSESDDAETLLDDDTITPFMIERRTEGGPDADAWEPIGFLQTYEETDPSYRHAGIDLALAARAQGHGYGTEALRLALDWLVGDLGHHRVVIDPRADNARAIHTYTKVGFRPVGVLRHYERQPDGSWSDGLLMDWVTSLS